MTKSTVSLRVNPKIWKDIKKLAVDRDLTISDLVEKALKNEIKKG